MVSQVIGDEALDEVVAVIVAGMPTQGQSLPHRRARCFESFRLQLNRQKFVRQTLIDQDFPGERGLLGVAFSLADASSYQR